MQQKIQEYLMEYKYRIELHSHTAPCSECSRMSPEKLIERLKEENYDAVVVANHFYYPKGGYIDAPDPVEAFLKDYYDCREAGEKAGIKVYLAAEYRFLDSRNDYLVFGVDEKFLRDTYSREGLDLESFYKEFKTDDILVIQAHPCRRDGGGGFPENPAYLDGIEIMNMHPTQIQGNTDAAKYAAENNIPLLLVGTDAHNPEHVGHSALRSRTLPENERELVNLIKSRDYVFEIGGHPMFPYIKF
ncbi:MAG: PHP domain-containing protein [Oscillospiraceae bacterium]|nr:PHP domain-containing protein [Oscillospiraceae bacterium]